MAGQLCLVPPPTKSRYTCSIKGVLMAKFLDGQGSVRAAGLESNFAMSQSCILSRGLGCG